jgi:hypothetical protein
VLLRGDKIKLICGSAVAAITSFGSLRITAAMLLLEVATAVNVAYGAFALRRGLCPKEGPLP